MFAFIAMAREFGWRFAWHCLILAGSFRELACLWRRPVGYVVTLRDPRRRSRRVAPH